MTHEHEPDTEHLILDELPDAETIPATPLNVTLEGHETWLPDIPVDVDAELTGLEDEDG